MKLRKMKLRKIFIVIAALVLSISLAACSSQNQSQSDNKTASKENVKLVFWNSAYKTVDENDKSKKKEDFYIYQAIKRFEDSHPGVTVDVQDIPGGDTLFTKFQTASIAKNGPDLTVLWSGNYMMKFKQFLEPLEPYLMGEDQSRIIGWEAASEGFKKGGKIYGYPSSTDGVVVLFYNKKLFAKAGIDMETERPKNIDEFLSMMAKLKAAGIMPFGLPEDGNFWQIPSYWIAQTVTPEGINQLVTGEKNFSDPRLIEIIAKWSDIYKKGYASIGQDNQLFYQGKVAMVTGGNWAINDARKALGDDLGMVKIPDFSEDVKIHDGGVGGVGNAFVVPNYSKHKKEAVDFIKFLMSKDEQIEKIKSGEGAITNVTDVNVQDYTTEPLIVTMQEWANQPSTIFWPDNIYPADLSAEINKLASVALTGKMSPKDFMMNADKKRDQIKESSK